MTKKNHAYDLIGDIHGEAGTLRHLLTQLGYREGREGFRHPERRVIFLGDYVDRGPAIRETLSIVRQMVEHEAAFALCGNHELDIILHDTPDGRGGWLRSRTQRHTQMHARTHAEFDGRPEEWADWLGWFQTLPFYLDLPGLRAVHACWDESQIAVLRPRRCLAEGLLTASADKKSAEGAAIDRLLKGPEVPLPPGMQIVACPGATRREMRVRWWHDNRGKTYREACLSRHAPGPAIPISSQFNNLLSLANTNDPRPIFFGHYWLPEQTPAPLAARIACLDYGVAAGGPLVAYRWDGEKALSPAKFVFISRPLAKMEKGRPLIQRRKISALT